MKLEDVEINKEYWVINGHWKFKVIEKIEEGVKCYFNNKIDIIPYNAVLFIENYINQ